jgi:hypothetical protein
VCGGLAHAGVASYLITLVDGTKAALPIWMTEASAARDADIRESGLVSVMALQDLRALVDEISAGWARSAASATDSTEPPTSGDGS